jgi:hypothetical protein
MGHSGHHLSVLDVHKLEYVTIYNPQPMKQSAFVFPSFLSIFIAAKTQNGFGLAIRTARPIDPVLNLRALVQGIRFWRDTRV